MTTNLELDIEIPDLAEVEVETPAVDATPSGGDTVVLVAVPGPPGPPGEAGGGVRRYRRPLVGVQNGSNDTFTTAESFRPDSTLVYLNGLVEIGCTETPPNTIVFEEPPSPDDTIRIDYTRS
jgi:hypothetical protein